MRLPAGMTVLFWGIMLWGSLSVAFARSIAEYRVSQPHFNVQPLRIAAPKSPGASGAVSPRRKPQESPQSPRASASSTDGDRDDPLLPPARRDHGGHMTPEDRRLLRQHIEDAVRELYSH